MVIPILVEPLFHDSYWCTESLKGIKKQAYQKKITLQPIEEADIKDCTFQTAQGVVLVVGSSINWINQIVRKLDTYNIQALLVAGDYSTEKYGRASCVLMDYQTCMRKLIKYLLHLGNRRIALYGVNPNSYTDKLKKETFISFFSDKTDVYYNYGSIAASTIQLFNNIAHYDAVICANDAVAIYLLLFLKEKGIDVPKDVQLVSFGNFFLSKVIHPTITSIVLDYYMLGQQAVDAYLFLSRSCKPINISILLDCKLYIRESTTQKGEIKLSMPELKMVADVDFYSDADIQPILSIEKLLVSADKIDVNILLMTKQGITQERIAENLNLSLSALRYRMKRLLSFYPNRTFKEMVCDIASYASGKDLESALALK